MFIGCTIILHVLVYLEECVYVGQTGGVRFTCQNSPVSPSSLWLAIALLPALWKLFRQDGLDLAKSSDTSGSLKCSVYPPHTAEFLSPGSHLSLWEAAINCCSLCFYSPPYSDWLLTHTLLFLCLFGLLLANIRGADECEKTDWFIFTISI